MIRSDNKIYVLRYTCLLIGVFLLGHVYAFNKDLKNDNKQNAFITDSITNTNKDREQNRKNSMNQMMLKDSLQTKCITPIRRTLNTTMLAMGSANMYDTYLSPLEYDGFSIKVINERMRGTKWFDYKFFKQQIIEIEFASGQNPARNVREYWGKARYQLGGHYEVYKSSNGAEDFNLRAGGFWDINVAGLYNERNGNNPATGRLYTNLNLSIMASYKWNKKAVRWQIDTPFMGMLFSPKYGQSYYEISLGNTVGLVNFASFHNQRALRNFITFDWAFNNYIVRVGYLGDWYQTKVNDIITHHYTHSIVIGFPLEGIMKKKEKTYNYYWE